MLKIFHLTTIH